MRGRGGNGGGSAGYVGLAGVCWGDHEKARSQTGASANFGAAATSRAELVDGEEAAALVFREPRNDEGEMPGIKFSDEVLRQWLADKDAKRDAALKALQSETAAYNQPKPQPPPHQSP